MRKNTFLTDPTPLHSTKPNLILQSIPEKKILNLPNHFSHAIEKKRKKSPLQPTQPKKQCLEIIIIRKKPDPTLPLPSP
jgi:hypothetical protein